MKRPNFTMGPWFIARESGEVFVVGPDYEPLCGEENAALIATAPKMFAKLVETSAALRAINVNILADDIDALIAEALGETP